MENYLIDFDYIKNLYPEQVKLIEEYVVEALKDYEYDGSALFEDKIDKETFHQITDHVFRKIIELDEVEEIIIQDDVKGMFTQKILLRALIQLVIINNLFIVPYEEDTKEEDTKEFETKEVETIYYGNFL